MPTPSKERFDLFISFARERVQDALAVHDELIHRGRRPYLFAVHDRKYDRSPDEIIDAILRDRLASSDALLILHDSSHVAAEWCGWEVETFRELKGPGAKVYACPLDHAPVLWPEITGRWAPGEPWPPEPATTPPDDDAQRPAAPPPSPSLRTLFTNPLAFALALGRPATGFRLFGRARPATRSGEAPKGPPFPWRALLGALGVQAVVALLAVVVGTSKGLGEWQRQLTLSLSVAWVGAALLAIVVDLPAALSALTFATPLSVGATFITATMHPKTSCDGMIAGGVAVGALAGAATATRLAQRAADSARVPRRRPDAPDALTVRRLLRQVADFVRAWRWWPAAFGVLTVALSLGSLWLMFYLVAAKPLASVCGWLDLQCYGLIDESTLVGPLVGALAGLLGALALGKARATTVRGRLRLRKAALPALATFAVLSLAGYWSTTEPSRAISTHSSLYALQMGLLASLLLLATFGFHGALSGWGRQTGDDALFGGICVLLAPPVLRNVTLLAVPVLEYVPSGRWHTLTNSLYLSFVGALLLGFAPALASAALRYFATCSGRSMLASAGLHGLAGAALWLCSKALPAPLAVTPASGSAPPPGPPITGPVEVERPSDDKPTDGTSTTPGGKPSPPEQEPALSTLPPSKRNAKLDEIRSKSPRDFSTELSKLTPEQKRSYWAERYKKYPDEEPRERLRQRAKELDAIVKGANEWFETDWQQEARRLEEDLTAELREAAPDDVKQLKAALETVRGTITDAKEHEKALNAATQAAPTAPSLAAAQAAQQNLTAIASRASKALRVAKDASDGAHQKRDARRAEAHKAWDNGPGKNGDVLSGEGGGHVLTLDIKHGYQVDLQFRIGSGNFVRVELEGCSVSKPLVGAAGEGQKDSARTEPQPSPCRLRLHVPGAMMQPTKFSLKGDGSSYTLGFEDWTDNDKNEPEVTITVTESR